MITTANMPELLRHAPKAYDISFINQAKADAAEYRARHLDHDKTDDDRCVVPEWADFCDRVNRLAHINSSSPELNANRRLDLFHREMALYEMGCDDDFTIVYSSLDDDFDPDSPDGKPALDAADSWLLANGYSLMNEEQTSKDLRHATSVEGFQPFEPACEEPHGAFWYLLELLMDRGLCCSELKRRMQSWTVNNLRDHAKELGLETMQVIGGWARDLYGISPETVDAVIRRLFPTDWDLILSTEDTSEEAKAVFERVLAAA